MPIYEGRQLLSALLYFNGKKDLPAARAQTQARGKTVVMAPLATHAASHHGHKVGHGYPVFHFHIKRGCEENSPSPWRGGVRGGGNQQLQGSMAVAHPHHSRQGKGVFLTIWNP
jgi:hypothetical protein